jgi:hypothetical protein
MVWYDIIQFITMMKYLKVIENAYHKAVSLFCTGSCMMDVDRIALFLWCWRGAISYQREAPVALPSFHLFNILIAKRRHENKPSLILSTFGFEDKNMANGWVEKS